MALKLSKKLISTSWIIFLLIIFSCGNAENQSVSDDNFQVKENQNISGLPPGIPSFPYIFSGEFYFNGTPGPENSTIFSRLGDLDSPEIITGDGTFKDLIIGPKTSDDITNKIEFYLINDGKIIKAEEEIPFDVVVEITNLEIKLNFNE
tara:strand:+ start:75 stop:521 length:447 start_codon:yes stop_codon:yes gene_type:complete